MVAVAELHPRPRRRNTAEVCLLHSFGAPHGTVPPRTFALTSFCLYPAGGQQGGLDFAENLRSRAERSSISAASGMSSYPPASVPSAHSRAKSVATMEQPVREIPKTPKVPDPIQERMLRGDFYMD